MKNNQYTQRIFIPLLAVAFIVLRLCNVIDWPWVWVLCPIWGRYAVSFFVAVGIALVREGKSHGNAGNQN